MLFLLYFINDLKNRTDLVRRVYLSTVVTLLVALSTTAQEGPKAVLVDEFGKITWEDYVARLDNLTVEMTRKPNHQAYMIFQNGEVKNDRERFRFYQWGEDHLRLRKIDLSRFNFIRAVDGQTQTTQFWIVPPGAEKPIYSEGEWNLELPRGTKPFIWTTTEWNSGLVLPAVHLSLDHFCEVLEGNPRSRVNFVIRARKTRQHIDEETLITKIMLEKCKVDSNRIRFFRLFENRPRWDYLQTEVWLLP
jgi:hypothetical protein